MNDGAKKEYIDQMNTAIRDWNLKLEAVKARVTQVPDNARISYHRRIDEWQKKQMNFKMKMNELSSCKSDAFEVLKKNAQNTWNELNVIVSKFEEKK